ncbi:MAG: hypothetical protein AAGF96_06045 [Bacteroidota bacterium]
MEWVKKPQKISELTKRQKKVVNDVFNGAVIITDREMRGAVISGKGKADYHIDNGVFFRLVEKGWIYQQLRKPFDYVLTHEALEILKTN